MIKVLVKNIEIPLMNILYHKRTNNSKYIPYMIEISLDNEKIINTLERFSRKKVSDIDFIQRIKKEDENKGSLGLIWWLINDFSSENNHNEDKNKEYYVLSTLDRIERINNKIILHGKISKDFS